MKFPHPLLNSKRQLRSGWWIAIFFVLLLALLAPLIIAFQNSAGGVPIWLQAGAVFIASLICQLLRRKPLSEWLGALDWRWPRDLIVGAAIGAVLMLAPAFFLWAIGAASFAPSTAGFAAILPGVALFAAVALTEELMFRGFAFQRLIDGLGQWPAQLIVAGFFVLTHSAALEHAGAVGYLAGVNIFLASIMFGLAFIRTRSLAMPIGLHFAANFVQGTLLGFGVSGNDEQGMLTPALHGPAWLTGGAFGLEASVPGLVCVIAIIALLLRWRRPAGVNAAVRAPV